MFVNLKREGGFGATGSEIAQTQARLLLSRVRVLSFGDATVERDGTPGPTGAGARTAVLAVPTAQVDALTLAEASGRLVLALRSPRDEDIAAQTVAIRAPAGAGPSNQAATGLVLSELSGSGAPAQAPRAAPTRVTHCAACGGQHRSDPGRASRDARLLIDKRFRTVTAGRGPARAGLRHDEK